MSHRASAWATVAAVAAVAFVPGEAAAAPTGPGELVNDLVRAEECEYCHSFNNAPDVAEDPMYAPYFTWRGSMMANASQDPVFWAGVAIASQDAEDPAETEACVRCHAPRAFLEGRGDAIAVDELSDRDAFGVECEFCHRMVEDAPPGNAMFTIDDTLVGGNVPRRGPWGYDGPDAETPPPPHTWIQDTFVGSSEACGTCHDVTTDRERVDADGNGLGIGFGEQRTYSEWAQSDFAQPGDDFRSCQDCHMPAVDDMPGCRDHVVEHHHETGGRRHDLLGANRFMVELMAEDATVLDGVAFNHTLQQMDEFVRTSASIDIEGPASVDLSQGLEGLTVTVTNETGHKLPTGYSEGRVMWLEVVARHEDEVLGSSGRWDPAVGAPSPETDAQLRRYQAVAEESSSGETFHLLRNDRWLEDTRIPPRGLTPDLETDPVGDRYALLEDGTWPHYDVVAYAFGPTDALAGVETGDLTVDVRLLYLINTPDYIDFLAAENVTNDAGNDIALRFDDAGGATPVVLAEASLSIPVMPAASGDSSSTGDPSGTAGEDTTSSTTATPGTTTSDDPTTASGSSSSTDAAADGGDGGGGDGCGCTQGEPHHAVLSLGLFGLARRRRR